MSEAEAELWSRGPSSSADLYPPKPTAEEAGLLRTLCDSLLTRTYTAERKAILRRFPTEAERMLAQRRLAELRPWIRRPLTRGEIEGVVLELMTALGGGEGEEGSDVKASEIAKMLADLPLWATKIACMRFGQGYVKPEEVGEQRLKRNYVPSSAHIHMVAAALVKPIYQEAMELWGVVNGTVVVEREKTPEEKEHVRRSHEAYRQRPALVEDAEAAARREETRERLLREGKAFADAAIAEQFAALGVEQPAGFPVSFGLLVQQGARVEEQHDGSMVLTHPPRSQLTRRRPT